MFSSLQTEDEINLTSIEIKGNKDEKVGKVIKEKFACNFPLDCLGVIMLFVRSTEVFKNVSETSRSVYDYLTSTNPGCCRFIKFKVMKVPKVGEFNYVHRLVVEDVDFSNKSMILFPNVSYLVLSKLKKVSWELFKHTSERLRNLTIDQCPKLTHSAKFYKSTKLISLRIDFSHIKPSISSLDTSEFVHLGDLERLEIHLADMKEYKLQHFQNLKKLRILRLNALSKIDDKIFEYMPDLEILDLKFCSDFTDREGFKHLKKVEDITLEFIPAFENENQLINECWGGRRPKKVKVENFDLLRPLIMGEIAPQRDYQYV